jgi:hypothetical protein
MAWTGCFPWTIIALNWADQDTIMDVGSWLRSLGLERYEAAFRENEIDAEERGSHALKGVPEPVTLFRIGGHRSPGAAARQTSPNQTTD